MACEKWLDVRSFGQVLLFRERKKEEEKDAGGISVGVDKGRFPYIRRFSVHPVTSLKYSDHKSDEQ